MTSDGPTSAEAQPPGNGRTPSWTPTVSGREGTVEAYELRPPSAQHQLDLFAGQWLTKVPTPGEDTVSGHAEAFHDERIAWGLDRLGPITGMTVAELGPLEGAHTSMLEAYGAGQVFAVEPHRATFLRCLVVKNLLGLRAHFELGDVVGYLHDHDRPFDLCVAIGVLSDLADPLELIALLGSRAKRILLWTHYWDADALAERPEVADRFDRAEPAERGELKATYHRYAPDEDAAAEPAAGPHRHGRWMEKGDVLAALQAVGFATLETAFDDTWSPAGPSLCVAGARRDAVSRRRRPEQPARQPAPARAPTASPWRTAATRLAWLLRRRGTPPPTPAPPTGDPPA